MVRKFSKSLLSTSRACSRRSAQAPVGSIATERLICSQCSIESTLVRADAGGAVADVGGDVVVGSMTEQYRTNVRSRLFVFGNFTHLEPRYLSVELQDVDLAVVALGKGRQLIGLHRHL